MRLRAAPGTGVAAALSLAVRAGLVRHPAAMRMLRRGGVAAAAGVAAIRSPGAPVLVRQHDALTGRELDSAVTATAAALAERFPAGARIGLRGDGGIETVVALAAAGLAGLDALPIGPRHGDQDAVLLARDLDAVLDPWDVVVREGAGDGVGVEGRALRRPPGRLLLASTGTTGRPAVTLRGRLGPRGMLQLADAERRLALPPGPLLVLAPPDHGHGLTMVLAGLVRGGPVLLGSGMRPVEQAELARLRRPAAITGVPAQLGRLFDLHPDVFEGVRLVVSGSSRLDPALRDRLAARGARVADCYGTTETGTVTVDGRPLAGVTIDLDDGRRIRITSPLGRVPRYPGDLGRIVDRRLVLEGREGALVDTGGELVAPARVEAELRALSGVQSARVTARDDDLLGTVLHADVVADDPALDADAIRDALLPRVGRAGLPRRITVTRRQAG